MSKICLREICHARSGDKGDTANIGIIVYDMNDYDLIKKILTTKFVKSIFKNFVKGKVVRYELPRLGALNFVLYNALDGGATRTLSMDAYGKCLSAIILSIDIDI